MILNKIEVKKAKQAIAEAKYQPGEAQELKYQEKIQLGVEGDYNCIVIGLGGSAFSSLKQ